MDRATLVNAKSTISHCPPSLIMVLRSFVSRDINLLIRAVITYVRPLVEYNTVSRDKLPVLDHFLFQFRVRC